jgi:hypothetical protein
MDGAETMIPGGIMAEQEPILTDPSTPEMGVHVRDYSRFIGMMKWTAIICFILGLIIIAFVL